jgi:hypothetical protein
MTIYRYTVIAVTLTLSFLANSIDSFQLGTQYHSLLHPPIDVPISSSAVHAASRRAGPFTTVKRWKSFLHASSDNAQDELDLEKAFEAEDDSTVIMRGSGEDDLPDEFWEDVEAGQPPQSMVMKQVRITIHLAWVDFLFSQVDYMKINELIF